MALAIRVFVEADAPLANLDKIGKSFVMFKDAFQSIGKELTSYFSQQVFNSEGGILGDKWAPLNERYRNYKATGHTVLDLALQREKRIGDGVNVYPGRGILVRTGAMQNSFTYDADNNSLTVGNTADYFVFHQSTREPREKIPRRPMMALNEDVKTIISEIIDKDIKDKLRDAGF